MNLEHVARREDMKNAYIILARKNEGKSSLERLRRRWQDNIRMDLREIWWEGIDWMHLA
jgi:hypothetical protein